MTLDVVELCREPWTVARRIGPRTPVVWVPAWRSYVVFSHAHAREVLGSSGFVSGHPFRASRRVYGRTMVDLDGAAHRPLRRTVRHGVNATVEAEGERLRRIVTDLLDGLGRVGHRGGVHDGRADLVEDLADMLPMRFLSAVLGLPAGSASPLASGCRTIVGYLEGDATVLTRARAARDELLRILEDLSAAGGRPRFGDLIHASLRADVTEARAARANAAFLLLAGTVSTSGAIGNVLACLLEDPRRYDDVVQGALGPMDAVREALRLETPVQFVPRFAAGDQVVGGAEIRAGATVQVCLASANRDPAVFDAPDDWCPGRPGMDRMLSFGFGRHSCVGDRMGLMEVVEVLCAVTRRFPNLRAVARPGPVEGVVFRRRARCPVDLGAGGIQ